MSIPGFAAAERAYENRTDDHHEEEEDHAPMTDTQQTIADGIELLSLTAGANSRAHGFHESWPAWDGYDEPMQRSYDAGSMRTAIAEKLDLIHEEASEALGEIRNGHDAGHVYYTKSVKVYEEDGTTLVREVIHHFPNQSFDENGAPRYKPEGFGVELADLVIRAADLAHLTGIDLGALIVEKMQYNATRPHKHGRHF